MSIKSPITLHLLNIGSTLKEYGKKKGLNYDMLVQTVNGHKRDRKCIEQLKKDNLWHLMEKEAKNEQSKDMSVQGS